MSDYMETLSKKLIASEGFHKAMAELAAEMRKTLNKICEAIRKAVRGLFKFVKTIKHAFCGIAPPKVRHLALYHKSERTRKKNWNRTLRLWRRTYGKTS